MLLQETGNNGPRDLTSQRFSIKKLIQINRTSQIDSRPIIRAVEDHFWSRSIAPSIGEIDHIFRRAGVDLAVQACKKALRESPISPEEITHTVPVTCINAGSPGLDLLVCQKLSLEPDINRKPLHGVACAGGVGAIRTAAAMAQSYSLRKRTPRVLVFACEIFSINFRADLDRVVDQPEFAHTATVPDSDGAAACIMCDELAKDVQIRSVEEILDWETITLPVCARYGTVGGPAGLQMDIFVYLPGRSLKQLNAYTLVLERLRLSLPAESALTLNGRAI